MFHVKHFILKYNMAGVYLHIPFCFTLCGYCDFYKTTKLDKMDQFQNVLLMEMESRSVDFRCPIDTFYVGGGTPSLIAAGFYQKLFSLLHKNFNCSVNMECTIEVNPDDISEDYLHALKNAGFNRVSIGIQSFHEQDLRQMGRRHNAQQSMQAVALAHSCGFSNIGIDLIYGLPWSTEQFFEKNLQILKDLPIQHLSAYHLTIEKGTGFHRLKQSGKLTEIDDTRSLREYEMLCNKVEKMGMQHYEVSNFCLPGYESKHNSSYWNGVPYLGLGPGSHSFDGKKRRWNKSDLTLYNKGNLELIFEEEVLSEVDFFNEQVMLGLRTSKGISLTEMEIRFPHYYLDFLKRIDKWIHRNNLVVTNGFITCSESSWFVVDSIIEDLFVV